MVQRQPQAGEAGLATNHALEWARTSGRFGGSAAPERATAKHAATPPIAQRKARGGRGREHDREQDRSQAPELVGVEHEHRRPSTAVRHGPERRWAVLAPWAALPGPSATTTLAPCRLDPGGRAEGTRPVRAVTLRQVLR